MKVKELTGWLEEYFPAGAAEDWDNVGLLTGDDEKEVKHVFLALDLTEDTLKEAIAAGADMILTHHPMIFSGIKENKQSQLYRAEDPKSGAAWNLILRHAYQL